MFRPAEFSYLAYGLHWHSRLPLNQFPIDLSDCLEPDITLMFSAAPVPWRKEISHWHSSRFCEDGFRFQATDDACFDYYDQGKLNVFLNGTDFGANSPHFYGTVVAAICACRNALPIHGTTLESNGTALLLIGPSGVGKSSVAAALAAKGYSLISDDLSVFRMNTLGQLVVSSGRTDIRLVPAAARLLKKALQLSPSGEQSAHGKVLMRPPSVSPDKQVVLRSVISLHKCHIEQGQDSGQKLKLLSANVFRPQLMQRLPGSAARAELLLRILGATRMLSLRTSERFNNQTAEELASRISEFHHS